MPLNGTAGTSRFGIGLVKIGRNLLTIFQIGCANFGKRDMAGGAGEKLGAKLVFKGGDMF
jgi:hypothetical protein